jgi:hypothetical protein
MNFTYLLSWPHLGKSYYGVRYGRDATEESVGTTYFSSSVYVKKFMDENGPPTRVEIRRRFASPAAAKAWEEKVLRRLCAVASPSWLNRANNNAFKGAVMDADTKASISASRRGKPMGSFYTDGIRNVRSLTGEVPAGFTKGFTPSPAQLAHYKKLNDEMTSETRAAIGKKAGDKTRGVAKPPGHAENVRAALLGKPRPWQRGDNNPSRRPEVRALISARKKANDPKHTI